MAGGHKYRIRYKVDEEVGEFRKDEADGKGLTDAFVFVSMLYPKDGSYSQTWFDLDGRTGKPIESNELFKMWMLMGKALSEREDLDGFKRVLAESPLGAFKAGVAGGDWEDKDCAGCGDKKPTIQ